MTEDLRCPECGSANVVFSKKRGVNVCEDCGREVVIESSFVPLRIFLSYGHDKHADDALRIKADLERRGHHVWFDLQRLREGRDWELYIEEGLKWCDKVVLLMTPYSVRRRDPRDPATRDGYCLNEIAKAVERNKLIIPVLLVELDGGPPTSICRIQYLDLRDAVPIAEHRERYEGRFDRLIRAIEQDDLDFEGGQARLNRLLRPLDFLADIGQHIARFTGRHWLIEEMDRWLRERPDSRVFWLTGSPGIGKTAITAYLCHTRRDVVAYHLCVHGHDDKGDPRRALLSIIYQMAQHFPEYDKRLQILDLESEVFKSVHALFDNLIVQPLSRDFPPPDGPRLVVIDAIDEATRQGRNEIAEFIRDHWTKTPPWLRLVVTSRPEAEIVAAIGGLSSLNPYALDAQRVENLDDLRNYLGRELARRSVRADAAVLRRIVEKSEGVFLYAVVVLEELDNGRLSLERLDEFPAGMAGYYQRFFSRQFPDGEKYKASVRPILESVCAQREALPLPLLASATGLGHAELRERLADLGSLFPVRTWTADRKSSETIAPFHKSVRDWLSGVDGRTGYFQAGKYTVNLTAGESRLSEACWGEYRQGVSSMSAYSLRHLPYHLDGARRYRELEDVLTDLEFIERKCREALTDSLLQDYDRAGAGLSAGPPIQTARSCAGALVVQCAHCHECMSIETDDLAHTVCCPKCEKKTRINSFFLEVMEQPKTACLIGPNRDDDLHSPPPVSAGLNEFARFVRAEAHILAKRPFLVTQQAANQPDPSAPCQAATAAEGRLLGRRPWLRWINKPDKPPLCLATLVGHTDSVFTCACSPDGSRYLSGSQDHTLRLWDAKTGTHLQKLAGHSAGIRACAWSPDGQWLLSGSEDGRLNVWDAASGKAIATLGEQGDGVTSCAFSPDGQRVLFASRNGVLTLWSWAHGGAKLQVQAHAGAAWACVFSPDGRLLTSGGWDREIKIWEALTGRLLNTLRGHTDGIRSLAFSPDGIHLASGSWDNLLKVWATRNAMETASFPGHTGPVSGCAYSPDGRWIASASGDTTARLWDVETGAELALFAGHSKWVNCCAASPDSMRVLTASADCTLRVWDAVSPGASRTPSAGHEAFVNAVIHDPTGTLAASASDDKSVRVWNTAAGQARTVLRGHTEPVTDCAFSPDGKRLVTAGRYPDNSLRLWDLADSREVAWMQGHTGTVRICRFSPDGTRILSGSTDRTLRLWDAQSGKETRRLSEMKGQVRAAAFSPDGRWVVAAFGLSLRIWDAETGILLGSPTHEMPVISCSYSPDGCWVASASMDQVVRIWNACDGKRLFSLRDADTQETLHGSRQDGDVTTRGACLFSADGRHLVSASSDGGICAWNVPLLLGRTRSSSIQSLADLSSVGSSSANTRNDCIVLGPVNGVTACALSADGRYVLAASREKTLEVWRLDSGEEVAVYVVSHPITALSIGGGGRSVVFGDETGGVHILEIKGLEMEPPIVTAVFSLARPGTSPVAGCAWCGASFILDEMSVDTIKGIVKNAGIAPGEAPSAVLPQEAFREKRLLAECPVCGRPIRFNPFFAGS